MDDNIIMKTDGVIAMIKKDDIMLILNDEAKHLKTLERTKTVDSDTLSTAEDIMTLDDLIYIKKLYDSIYSSSHLVKYGENFYHLKVIPKKLIISYNIEGHINNELQINNTVFHPFISKYFNSFEDNKAVYIMREFINGMDLWNVIREIGIHIDPILNF